MPESVVRPLHLRRLLVLFRITGNRSLGQISTFDFVLLLIISEAIQRAIKTVQMLGADEERSETYFEYDADAPFFVPRDPRRGERPVRRP